MMRAAFLAVILGLMLAGGLAVLSRRAVPTPEFGSSVVGALSAADGAAGFERARRPRTFVFPADGGPHAEFQTEWWYFTGNLQSANGRHYGYQFTVFRRGLARPAPRRKSDWAASQVYFAHFTVTDVEGRTFHADERWSRDALGLAGARAVSKGRRSEPGAASSGVAFDAWVDSWSARADARGTHLMARSGDASIDLHLTPSKPVALQGDRGLSHKSDDVGNASYYYSVTRLATDGVVTVGGRAASVHGASWLDREWSTSALGPQQVGWDWFSLQLSDGREVMLYQMRRKDGHVDTHSSGSVVYANGHVRPLRSDEFVVERQATWTSPRSGAIYPAAWRVRIPSETLDVRVVPWLPDQELCLSFVYWEGAVRIQSAAGDSIRGDGYVELTGYAP